MDAFGTGLAAYSPIDPTVDLRGKPSLRVFVKDSLEANQGDLQILLDDTPDCSSPVRRLDVPGLAPAAWTEVIGLAIGRDGGARTPVEQPMS